MEGGHSSHTPAILPAVLTAVPGRITVCGQSESCVVPTSWRGRSTQNENESAHVRRGHGRRRCDHHFEN